MSIYLGSKALSVLATCRYLVYLFSKSFEMWVKPFPCQIFLVGWCRNAYLLKRWNVSYFPVSAFSTLRMTRNYIPWLGKIFFPCLSGYSHERSVRQRYPALRITWVNQCFLPAGNFSIYEEDCHFRGFMVLTVIFWLLLDTNVDK